MASDNLGFTGIGICSFLTNTHTIVFELYGFNYIWNNYFLNQIKLKT
jgi:hypothetical protein